MELTAESATWAEGVLENSGTIFTQHEVNRSFGTSAAIAAAASTPPSHAINALLNSIGKAPGTSTTVTVPAAPASGDASLIRDVQTLDSYISVLAALVLYNNDPSPYDLHDGKQAARFCIDVANARNFVVLGGTVKAIRLYLPMHGVTTQTLNKSITTGDLHLELLTAMFDGLGLTDHIIKAIDGVLTGILDSLKNLQLSFETQEQTLNHFATFYHLTPVPESSPVINQMDAEFIYLQLGQASWEAAFGKSSVAHFNLDATLTRTSATMSAGLVEANSSNIANSLMQLTGNDAAKISKMTGMKGIRT